MNAARQTSLRIALLTFSVLVLELAIIRWMSQQIRVFAYLNNLLLIGAFLGIGFGLGLARKHTTLIRWMLPLLTLLAVLLAFSKATGLIDLSFPDISVALWGADGIRRGGTFLTALATIVALFLLVASVFSCAGNYLGVLFRDLPPLRAYSADLLGSFLGVCAMAIAALFSTSPPVWFALGTIPIVLLSRRVTDLVLMIAVVMLSAYSIQSARFSPYNRLDLFQQQTPAGSQMVLAANRDFHQYLFDLSDAAVNNPGLTPQQHNNIVGLRLTYDLPFLVTATRKRALVVGAGTGNDVAAALRNGFDHVTSVDIDPEIIRIGRRAHPERPYGDRRVTPVVNDARNFFETYQGPPYDTVCFGLLDSHAMFSAMSTLRLDNYVYTADGLRAAWRLVAPGGTMSISFQVWQGEWLADRITAAIQEATGLQPVVVGGEARTFIVGKGFDARERLAGVPLLHHAPHDLSGVRVTSDDWPFLYLRPDVFPIGYVAVLSTVLLIAAGGVRFAYGAQTFRRGTFDGVLFLMGAAFLLIETRGVTDLSLLFGSTWVVNSAVFGGVLFLALIANEVISRIAIRRIELWFLPLGGALLLSYWVRPSALLQLPYLTGGILGSLINALPIGFAAIIFSSLFRSSPNPSAALGSNLLGAVVGGCIEYVSLYTGLRSVTLIALIIYLCAFLLFRRRDTIDDLSFVSRQSGRDNRSNLELR